MGRHLTPDPLAVRFLLRDLAHAAGADVAPSSFIAGVAARAEWTGDCLLWRYSVNAAGQPQMRIDRGDGVLTCTSVRRELARQMGLPTEGRTIRAACRNPRCVRPMHTVSNTWAEMAQDNARTGKLSTPARSAAAKRQRRAASTLTPAKVRAIYLDPRKQQVLADEHGVSRGLISRIKRRQVWADAIATVAPVGPGRFAVERPEPCFSAMRPGQYLPADTAVARRYA